MATERKYLSLEKLGLYDEKIKKVITDGDSATLAAAKKYFDDNTDLFDAAGSAATAKSEAIAAAEAAVAAEAAIARAAEQANATGVTEAKAAAKTADDKAVAAQGAVDALAGKVGTVPEGSTVMGIITEIQEKAYDDTEIQGKVSALESNKADKTQVATDIASAKTELEGKINLKADQTALDAVSGVANAAATKVELKAEEDRAKGEEARIEGLVTAEAARAAGVEAGLDERLVEVETFFKTAEGETISDALDTLVEIQKFITDEGAAADEMVKDIAANAKAIEDMDAAYKAADTTLQGNIDTLSGTVATKAAQADLEAAVGRIGSLETASATHATKTELAEAVEALEGVDAGFESRIAAVEGKLGTGEDSVDSKIEAAKTAAINAAAADATSKANAAEAAAKGHADSLNTAMNTRVEALEAIDHEHANKALLDTYDQTNADIKDAVAKKHAHANADVLDGITAAKVTAWDKAEENAKAHATELNGAMDTRMLTVEAWQTNMKEISEDEINSLFA